MVKLLEADVAAPEARLLRAVWRGLCRVHVMVATFSHVTPAWWRCKLHNTPAMPAMCGRRCVAYFCECPFPCTHTRSASHRGTCPLSCDPADHRRTPSMRMYKNTQTPTHTLSQLRQRQRVEASTSPLRTLTPKTTQHQQKNLIATHYRATFHTLARKPRARHAAADETICHEDPNFRSHTAHTPLVTMRARHARPPCALKRQNGRGAEGREQRFLNNGECSQVVWLLVGFAERLLAGGRRVCKRQHKHTLTHNCIRRYKTTCARARFYQAIFYADVQLENKRV